MSDQQPAQWAPGLADAFTYQIEVISSKRALESEKKRAARAEKQVTELTNSPWWRLTAKPRAISARIRGGSASGNPQQKARGQKQIEKKQKVGAAGSPLPEPQLKPAEWASERADAMSRRLEVILREFDVAEQERDVPPFDLQLSSIADLLASRPDDRALAWLTYIAVCAKYPKDEDVLRFSTDVQVFGAPEALAQLLARCAEAANSGAQLADLELLRDVVVDPSLTSRRNFHTGIQRVVRETVPRWAKNHPVELMVWASGPGIFRPPSVSERWRILEFEPGNRNVPGGDQRVVPTTISVPWNTTVIAPEPTGPIARAEALATMATWSNNQLATIYYDFIMYIFPEAFREESRVTLSDYIPAVRTSTRVSAISDAVARDMRNYCETFANAGMPEPAVASQVLPVESTDLSEEEFQANVPRVVGVPGLPVVLSVASIEPRKNHITLMRAAERLWQQGEQFQLVMIGWGSWNADGIVAEFERLRDKGRPIRLIRRADEALLWTAFRVADFSVYISLVEGYGLPAAESIAAGTPVVLSNVGSMAEIGVGGGALMVNPRDLNEVAGGIRTLLNDREALAKLRQEATQRPQSTWDDYASATWRWLVDGQA